MKHSFSRRQNRRFVVGSAPDSRVLSRTGRGPKTPTGGNTRMAAKQGLKVAGIIALAMVTSVDVARAATATSTMNVSATVSNTCTISAGALAFGTYDPVSANASLPLRATATLTVNCTNGASTT